MKGIFGKVKDWATEVQKKGSETWDRALGKRPETVVNADSLYQQLNEKKQIRRETVIWENDASNGLSF
jgi:hypothetical protein